MDRRTFLVLAIGMLLLAACGKAISTISASVTETTVPVVSSPTLAPATVTETVVVPTKTSEGIDYSQAFNVDPQNIEDVNNEVMEAPVDPALRAEWVNGYLAAVDNKLESGSYTGIIIKPVAHSMSIDRYRNVYSFYPINLKPIASYKYQDANGNWLLVKTYPVEDPTKKDGDPAKYGSFSLTDTFENAIVTGDEIADPDLSKPVGLEVWYANDALDKYGWAPLAASILPKDDGKVTSIENFFLGRGIESGLETETLVNGGWHH